MQCAMRHQKEKYLRISSYKCFLREQRHDCCCVCSLEQKTKSYVDGKIFSKILNNYHYLCTIIIYHDNSAIVCILLSLIANVKAKKSAKLPEKLIPAAQYIFCTVF